MSLVENFKKVPQIKNQHSIKVLHECAELVQKGIRPSGDEFSELLDIISPVTDFNKTIYLTDVEKRSVQDLLIKTFTYMHERSRNNDINEVKRLIKEIIVISSKLYANVVLNEMDKKDE